MTLIKDILVTYSGDLRSGRDGRKKKKKKERFKEWVDT